MIIFLLLFDALDKCSFGYEEESKNCNSLKIRYYCTTGLFCLNYPFEGCNKSKFLLRIAIHFSWLRWGSLWANLYICLLFNLLACRFGGMSCIVVKGVP